MLRRLMIGMAFGLVLLADATLKGALGLDMDQARKVDAIQAKYRQPFAAKRQDQNREMRVLRRARIANDSAGVAAQETVVNRLQGELQEIRKQEDEEIRRVLTPAQQVKFEEYLKLRKEMIGSSRDDSAN